MYPHPRVFGGKQLINTRYQVGCSIKLGISWGSSTIYLDVHPPTGENIERLSCLHLTCGKPYSPYSPVGISYIQYKLDNISPGTGKVRLVWMNKSIQ